jgi:hypothetical protein
MNKNSKSVKHAKAVLKYWNKPFCVCLLNYIDELEKKAYKCEYYQEHADIFYQEIEKLKSKKYILNAETNEIKEIPISENYISKDKIKEKINEYNKKCDECNFQKSEICKEFKVHYNCSIQSVLEVLKELIGEINK